MKIIIENIENALDKVIIMCYYKHRRKEGGTAMSIFSERIIALMNSRGLSQKELAAKVDVTESAMSYYVKGVRTPRSDVLTRMARELGTTTDYLLGTSEVAQNSENKELLYLQRNLGKLDPDRLKKAEALLKTVFDDIFEDDDEG